MCVYIPYTTSIGHTCTMYDRHLLYMYMYMHVHVIMLVEWLCSAFDKQKPF